MDYTHEGNGWDWIDTSVPRDTSDATTITYQGRPVYLWGVRWEEYQPDCNAGGRYTFDHAEWADTREEVPDDDAFFQAVDEQMREREPEEENPDD